VLPLPCRHRSFQDQLWHLRGWIQIPIQSLTTAVSTLLPACYTHPVSSYRTGCSLFRPFC
jgi:hypothetical protein